MKKIIISSIALLLLFGCGSKKKITSYSKGYDVSYNSNTKEENTRNVNRSEEENSTSKITRNQNNVTEMVEAIFGDDGRIRSYRWMKQDNSSSGTDESSNNTKSDSTETSTDASMEETSFDQSETESEVKDVERTQANPVWNWIGGALAICIVGLVIWKVVLKK